MADDPNAKHGIPGGGQIVENTADGYWYVVYPVPESTAGTQLAYRIEDHDDLTAIFGPGVDWKVDRTDSWDPVNGKGYIDFGPSRQLANLSAHPFDAFVDNFQTEANVRPWLRDPEVLALTTRALLEGRTVTQAELAGTNWWKTNNDAQRQWASTAASDPATAQQKINDARIQTKQILGQMGIANPPAGLAEWMADQVTSGRWTQVQLNGQISKLADPYASGDLDPELAQRAAGMGLATQQDNTSKVDGLLDTWLGPVGKGGWTQQMRDDAAGKLRNDPSGAAEDQLVKQLQQQRLALLPEYADPSLSYDAIAANWRGQFQQIWGQPADETDPLFQQVLRVGGQPPSKDQPSGLSGVQQLLLNEGLKRGVGAVTDKALSDLGQAFGGTQRSAA